MIRIYEGGMLNADRIAALLEDEGIPVFVKDNIASARIAGFGIPSNSIEVLVEAVNAERAMELVKAFDEAE